MKTNKSYIKRLKKTRSGKLLARTPGQDHFNAKETGEESLKGKRTTEFKISNKDRGRFLGF
jgi:ribosomal protein L35